jgi:hypothetical protein
MIRKTFDLKMALLTGQVVTKPIGVVQLNSKYWIDLQTVLLALGMSWPKWGMYFRGCADKYRLLRHDDAHLLGVVLVPPNVLVQIMEDLYQMPEMAQRWTARNRIEGISRCWSAAWMKADFEHVGGLVLPRKVSASTVRDLHKLIKQGLRLAPAAVQLGISAKTASRLKSGNYPMDKDTNLAWYETFGGGRASV